MRDLTEARFTDLTPLGQVLEHYRGQGLYIHFTNPKRPQDIPRDAGPPLTQRSPLGVPKVGVNPKKFHQDPPGVYFYPIDWLLQHDRFLEGEQWATNWPHYVIADIDFSGEGINLSTITEEEIEELANRNGWFEDWRSFIGDPRNSYYDKSSAHSMWALLKSLNSRDVNRQPWLRTLRGVEYIIDHSGVIFAVEPEQVCAINPRIIKVLYHGTQPKLNSHDYTNFDHWRHLLNNLFAELQKRHGGKIIWKQKRPEWRASGDDWSFSMGWRDSYSMGGLAITMRRGEIEDSDTIPPSYLNKHEYEEILDNIEQYIAATKRMTNEGFNPVIDPEEAKKILRKVAHWSQKDPVVNVRANTSSYSAVLEREQGRMPVKSKARISVDEKSVTLSVEAKINDQTIIYGSGSDAKSLWANALRFSENALAEVMDPDNYRAISEEYHEAFLGYLYNSTGFAVFEQYEGAFYQANSAELYRQIERAFRRVGW